MVEPDHPQRPERQQIVVGCIEQYRGCTSQTKAIPFSQIGIRLSIGT
jgi:hypothetical protein